MINKFCEDIYFKDTFELKQQYIHICEEINKQYNNIQNGESIEKITKKSFNIFETNDFVFMADYLQYDLITELANLRGSEL